MRGFLGGILATLVAITIALVAVVQFGLVPAGADVKPPALEEYAAKRGLHAQIARDDVNARDPLQATEANLAAGLTLYGANCAVCHGAADAKPSILTEGFYIAAPQLAKDGVEDDPEAVTYWKLQHGIRFTAMPSFGATLSTDDLWRLTLFVKHMDALPPAVEARWKKLPSAAASPVPAA